jgi:hypothetical protein
VLITFALTAISLLIIGVDLLIILAIIAGLLTFIPTSDLLAIIRGDGRFLQSPQVWIFVFILFCTTGENNIITLHKEKLIPAALLLFFQMIVGALSGGGWEWCYLALLLY